MNNRELWQASLFSPRVAGARATGLRRTNRHEEQAILNCVLKVLRLHPRVAWCARINTGGFKDARGQYVRFGFPGCPDILGQMKPLFDDQPGAILAIEIKSAKGRLTDDQEFMLAKIRANGGVSGVARSIADALAIVEERVP